MNLLLANRDFQLPADGWFQLAPRGEVAHAEEGVIQVIDDAALKSLVNRFNEAAKAPNFGGVLVDYDHFSLDTEKPSEAAGWIVELQNRADGLWGKIRWSDTGEAAVKGGRYRFLSPVWNRPDCEELGNGRVRPLRLANAAVTNDPNMKGMRPMTNRKSVANAESDYLNPDGTFKGGFEGCVDYMQSSKGLPKDNAEKLCAYIGRHAGKIAGREEWLKRADAVLANENQPQKGHMEKVMREKLIQALGLAADVTDDAIVQAVQALSQKGTDATKKADEMMNRVKTMEAEKADAQVNADLDAYKDVIPNREQAKALVLANRSAAIEHFKGLREARVKMPNRRDNQLPTAGGTPGDADDGVARQRAAAIRNRANEIMAREKIPYVSAFQRAEAETKV